MELARNCVCPMAGVVISSAEPQRISPRDLVALLYLVKNIL
jgi:hypothetical protein